MNSEPADYRQAEEAEQQQWEAEHPTRQERDEEFRRQIEQQHPWLKLWKEEK